MLRHFLMHSRDTLGRTIHRSASLGAVGARELSGPSCLSAPAASARSCTPGIVTFVPLFLPPSLYRRGLWSSPPEPTLQLQFWRHSTSASVLAAAAASGTSMYSAGQGVKEVKAATPARKSKAKPAAAGTERISSAAAAQRKGTVSKASSSKAAKATSTKANPSTARVKPSENRAKPRTARATKAVAKSKSTTSGTARGRAAAERRRATAAKADAKAKARARAAASKAKEQRAIAKAKAKEKEAQRIKRPLTAINLFVRDQFRALGGGGVRPPMVEVARRYKDLPAAEKEVYELQAAASKSQTAQLRAERAKERAARRRVSPFILFAMEARPGVRTANPDMSFLDIGRRLGEMWRLMPTESKKKYLDMAEADRIAKGLEPPSPKPPSPKPSSPRPSSPKPSSPKPSSPKP